MAKDMVIDFSGADPVQSTSMYDRIPEGAYAFKVAKAAVMQTKTDKPMVDVQIEIAQGDQKGKKIRDMFVVPRKGKDDAVFGLQRLHGLMVACGIKKQKGRVKLSAIVKVLKGKGGVCEVQDNEIPATDDRPATKVSRPVSYYSVKSEEARALVKSKKKP
ncbi:hypothetical protein LCGC14_0879430, partial [marine sediment metagenome]